jgi:hypothetical protein
MAKEIMETALLAVTVAFCCQDDTKNEHALVKCPGFF